MHELFRKFSTSTSAAVGSSWVFILAVFVVLGWAVTGPLFGFSNTWQLVINTGTTIVTFLMVFLIQNTQNRDSKAVHLKLDELLRGVKGARTSLVDLEEMSDADLNGLQQEFSDMHRRLGEEIESRVREDAEQEGAHAGAEAGADAGEHVAKRVAQEEVENTLEREKVVAGGRR